MFVIFTEYNRVYRLNDCTGETWRMDGDTWKPVADAGAPPTVKADDSGRSMWRIVHDDMCRWQAVNSRRAKEVHASASVMAKVAEECRGTSTNLADTKRIQFFSCEDTLDWYVDPQLVGFMWRFV